MVHAAHLADSNHNQPLKASGSQYEGTLLSRLVCISLLRLHKDLVEGVSLQAS